MVAIDEIGDWPDRPLLVRLVGRRRRSRFRLGEVGCRIDERHLLPGIASRPLHEGLDFAERPGAVATGPVLEQIAVEQRLDLQAGDARHPRLGDDEDLRSVHPQGEDEMVLFLGRMIESPDAPELDTVERRPGDQSGGRCIGPGLHLALPAGPGPLHGCIRLREPLPDGGER